MLRPSKIMCLRHDFFVLRDRLLGQEDPTRAHVGSVFSECGLSYSGERAYQAPSSFCLLRVLLGLKLRQVLFRGILVLPNDVIFQEFPDLEGGVSNVALLAVDLSKQEVEAGLMVLRVDGNRLQSTFLRFR